MLFSPQPPSPSVSGADSAAASVRFRDGVYIAAGEGPGIWCDVAHRRDLCFASSAQVLRVLRGSDSLLCSERSFRLYEALHDGAKKPPSALLSPTGRPFQLGALRIELFPSGHLPGAASLWVRGPDGGEIVYAGAPNPASRSTAEPMQVRSADCLIVQAPIAASPVDLPTPDAALQALSAELAQALHDGSTCVVLCSGLTTAPELIHALRTQGLLPPSSQRTGAAPSLLAHAQIVQACAAYRRVGALPDHLPMSALSLRRAGGALPPGGVLFWPLTASLDGLAALTANASANGPAGGAIASNVRVVFCSALALLPEVVAAVTTGLAQIGLSAPRLLPYPDSIDRSGLVRYVRDTGCRQVFLTAGSCDELAQALRPAACSPLGPPSQLHLF